MNPSRYFERISFSGDHSTENGFEHLVHLQRHHLYAVPFTNLFVYMGNGTTLRPQTVVPRIVAGGGGLCYDLNGAFAWLLEEIGYDVTLISARPKADDGSYGAEYDHLALLVDDHLVDVGFGDFARQPLPLDGVHRTDVSGTYRVLEYEDGYVAQKRTDGGWENTYRFSTIPRSSDEFIEMADYHSTSPDSPFTGDLLATLPTEAGRLTFSGRSLTITDENTRRKQDIPPEQVSAVLRDQFGLALS